jgi:hypothetical protein
MIFDHFVDVCVVRKETFTMPDVRLRWLVTWCLARVSNEGRGGRRSVTNPFFARGCVQCTVPYVRTTPLTVVRKLTYSVQTYLYICICTYVDCLS